jgi:transcriptional regulator with XRE-family HTH domain
MERIRQLRKVRGLSQAKLAVMADMDPATLNRLERGTGNPNLKTLERVADALGVGVADFFLKAPPRSPLEPSLLNGLEEEQRRTELEEIRESYREEREGVERYLVRWERWLETGGIPEEAVREFLMAAGALYPVLRGLSISEVTEISIVLRSDTADGLTDEAKAESAILPLVNRYWELGHKLTEVWNERFPEEENIVDLEAMRQEPRFRRTG